MRFRNFSFCFIAFLIGWAYNENCQKGGDLIWMLEIPYNGDVKSLA